MKHHLRTAAATALALPLTVGAWTTGAQAADIVSTLRQSEQFQIMAQALEAAGMAEELQSGGPYTVFAPTDEAFGAMPLRVFNQLIREENREQLRTLLQHHIVEGQEIPAQQVLGQTMRVDSMAGDSLVVDGTGAVVMLVPTGVRAARIGDEVYVQRQIASVTVPAITVSTAVPAADGAGQQPAAEAWPQVWQEAQPEQAQAGQEQEDEQQQAEQQQQTQQQRGEQAQAQQQATEQQPGARQAQEGEQQQAATRRGQQQQQQQQQATAARGGQQAARQAEGEGVQEIRQALREARDALRQGNREQVIAALDRANEALDEGERQQLQQAIDRAEQALQQGDRRAARQALQEARQLMQQGEEPSMQGMRRPAQEARGAMGQQDMRRMADLMLQAHQRMARAGRGAMGEEQDQEQGVTQTALVVTPGIQADNGVVYGINQLLVPATLEQRLGEMLGRRQAGGQAQQGEQQRQQGEGERQQQQ